MTNPPLNLNSDDAAIFAANTPDTDSDDTEDPVARGASKAGQLDMFRARTPRPPRTGVHSGALPGQAGAFQRTPGARHDPLIGLTDVPSGPKLA